jgi:dipeptidyl aminopeptidase/acylaminoacyl peptidase
VALVWKVLAVALAQGAAPAPGTLELQPVAGVDDVVAAHVPPIPKALAERVQTYAEVRSASLHDVSEDGRRVLIGTNFCNSEQLHQVSEALGAREQLTFFQEPVAKAAFLPGDPLTLFFLQAPRGGSGTQLQRLDLRTARVELLTDGKSRHETFVLSPNGRWIAYSGTARNGKDADVYWAEVANAQTARRLTEREGTLLPLAFSPDGMSLLVKEERGPDDAELSLLDTRSGARRLLTPEARTHGKASVREALFSADGKAVYLLSNRSQDTSTLFRVELGTPEPALEPLLPDRAQDVERLAVAQDGTVAFSTDEAGVSHLYVLRGKHLEPLSLPTGVVSALRFARDRSDVLFLALESPTSPMDVWALSLKTKKLTRWTKSEVGGLDARSFVAPESVHYQAMDGRPLQALLYKPRDVPKGRRLPVVVAFHDGPESEERASFHPEYQLLLEQGMAVLAPNVRGSSGAGKASSAADDGVKREEVLLDIQATLRWLGRQPDLDASHVAALGTGYGGYLALAAAGFYPGDVRAAVDVEGMAHLPTFLETAPPYSRDALRAEYGDERLPEVRAVLERLSPLNAADRMKASLLVVQGKKDTRAPRAQAEQLVRARGKDGWYLLALEEGRGPWTKEHRLLVSATVLLFLQETLLAPPAPVRH